MGAQQQLSIAVPGQLNSATLEGPRCLFGSLDELVNSHGDLVKKHFFRAINSSQDKFAALHAALWSGGTSSMCRRGVIVDEPLHILSAITPGGDRFRAYAGDPRRRCRSNATVRDDWRRGRRTGFHCGAIELLVGPGAKLRYVNLQNWGHGVWHFAHQKGARRSRRRVAMDDRRAGQPAGEGESARGAGRPRRRSAGQRRDVHRGQAAPLVPHAAAP